MFVVLEGTDGAGTGTQLKRVAERLRFRGIKVDAIELPNKESLIYKHLLHPHLHGEIPLSKEAEFLLFAVDQLMLQERLKGASEEGIFLADRYFTSALVYQCQNEEELKRGLKFAKDFGLSRPDLIIFLEVPPKEARKRKQIEPGHEEGLDKYESDFYFQKELERRYKKMIEKNIFGRWTVVDGVGSEEEVTERIVGIVRESFRKARTKKIRPHKNR